MISTPDRVKAIELIDEAVDSGARRFKACRELNICDRTYRRWSANDGALIDARTTVKKASPCNRLGAQERQAIIDVCNQPELANLPPGQIVPILADRGTYIGSEATFYRVLHEVDLQHHRGRSKAPQQRRKPTSYCATAPNQVWSWGVSYLPSPIRGQFYYLYLVLEMILVFLDSVLLSSICSISLSLEFPQFGGHLQIER